MNTKNKNNMKRHLHFYQWLLCLLLTIGWHLSAFSQGMVTCLEDLQAGDVIKIYPYGHYGEADHALLCEGNRMFLTSSSITEKGSEWTLIDAGRGYYYLKNELGCYWAYQDSSSDHSLTCTTHVNSAVKIKLTWDSKKKGVCFWNQEDGKGLNNLYGSNNYFNWYSSPYGYNSDTNTTFEVYSPSHGTVDVAVINGIKYSLHSKRKTAQVLANNYKDNVIIPQIVSYNGNEFRVTSLGDKCFYNCSSLTNITLPEGITSFGELCFLGCSSLTSITLPESITFLGDWCFDASIKRIIINAPIPPGGEKLSSDFTLYVPKGTLATYKNTEPWSRAGAYYEG